MNKAILCSPSCDHHVNWYLISRSSRCAAVSQIVASLVCPRTPIDFLRPSKHHRGAIHYDDKSFELNAASLPIAPSGVEGGLVDSHWSLLYADRSCSSVHAWCTSQLLLFCMFIHVFSYFCGVDLEKSETPLHWLYFLSMYWKLNHQSVQDVLF